MVLFFMKPFNRFAKLFDTNTFWSSSFLVQTQPFCDGCISINSNIANIIINSYIYYFYYLLPIHVRGKCTRCRIIIQLFCPCFTPSARNLYNRKHCACTKRSLLHSLFLFRWKIHEIRLFRTNLIKISKVIRNICFYIKF